MTQQAGSAQQQKALQEFLSRKAGQNQAGQYLEQLKMQWLKAFYGTDIPPALSQRAETSSYEQTHPRSEWRVPRSAVQQVTQDDMRPFQPVGPGYYGHVAQPGPKPIIPGQGRGNNPVPYVWDLDAMKEYLMGKKRPPRRQNAPTMRP
jgi:hypothetical protein